jgi:5-methylthioadenosine/S-adenosylhomocysteine deaminase
VTDIFVKNGFVLTMLGEGVGMIEDGAIAIEETDIIEVGKTHILEKKHGSAELVLDARGKAVLPGFVDAHVHTSLTLLRGEAQDVPEIEWMLKTIAPFDKHLERDHRIKGTSLGVLEAVKSGTTCLCEIGGDMDKIAEEAIAPSGVRAILGNTINEIGADSRPDAQKPYVFHADIGDRKLRQAIDFINEWNGAEDGRIGCLFSPHAADMMGKELLLRVRREAEEHNLPIHLHVAQGEREAIQIKIRYGTSTVRYLDEIGYLDERVIAAHCHHTTDEEVGLLARKGVRYVSCPSSIGLIDGITPPLGLFLSHGGRSAAIGTDQASGNNSHNMLVEMKVAALLNKTRHRDPTMLPAWKMLRIATIEGARTLGLADKIGTLEPGKKADVVILSLKQPHMRPIITTPVRNIAPNIVYSARGDEVETVIIDGKMVMKQRKMMSLNEGKIIEEAQKASEEVTRKATQDYFTADSFLAKAAKKRLL